MSRALRLPLLLITLALLAACKADKFDVELATGDLAAAAAGQAIEAPFEMVFSNLGEIDDDKRAQFAEFEAIMRRYMTVDAFITVPGDSGTELQIEGRLPVTASDAEAPYFLHLAPSQDFPGYWEVEMQNGSNYAEMQDDMQSVSYMLTPDRYQPTRFKLAGNGEALIAPGAFVDGEAQALFLGTVEDRLWLSFRDGVWDDTGALFLVKLP